MADGRIIIDTEIDNSGLESGLKKATASAKSQAAKLAAEYKKQGMSASEAFKKAWSEIERDSDVQASKTAKNWENSTNKLNDIAKKGLKIFTGAVTAAGTALSGLGVAGIKLASDLEEVQNVVDVTFGDNAKVINEWAKEAKTAFGMSELSAKQFNGTMGAMLKSMGLGSGEVLNMSTSMVGLAADFASFYNLEHEEAFNKIRAGISGETEPLKQLGINMSVANLEAYALTQGITKQYKEMSQAEQATLRYNYLMSAGADAQGDFARTSDSLANQMRVAKLNMQELGSEIGQLLLPVAQEAVTKFNELGGQLKEALSSPEMQESILKIADGLSELIETVAELISEWLPKIIEGFAWLVDNADIIATGIVGIGTAMLTLNVVNMILGVVGAFKKAKKAQEGLTVAQWLYNAAVAANPIGIFIALIVGLVAAIVYLWNTNDGFRDAVISAWNAIKDAGIAVWEWLVKFFTEDIPAAWQVVVDFFQGIPEWFGELWSKVTDKFKEWGTNISNFFTETIPQWIQSIFDWFNQLPYMIGYALGYVVATVVKWGTDMWNYLTTNVPIWIDNVVTFFAELPSKIATWLVETFNKLVAWGNDMLNKAIEVGSNFLNSIVEWFAKLPGRISKWFDETINKVVSFAQNAYYKALEAGQNIVDAIVNTVRNLPSQIYDIGVSIVKGLWDGILSMGSWIGGKVSGFFNGIVDGAKSVLKINSPSKVFRDKIGKSIPEGVAVGIDKGMPKAEQNIKDNFGNLVNSVNLSDVTAQMTAAVNYETSKPSVAVMTSQRHNENESNPTNVDLKDSTKVIEVPVIIDGREFMRATAPYQDEYNNYYEGR